MTGEFRLESPSVEASTAEEFTGWVAERFQHKAQLDADMARSYALVTVEVALESEGIKFGAADYGWTRSEANDMADEELAHWEG